MEYIKLLSQFSDQPRSLEKWSHVRNQIFCGSLDDLPPISIIYGAVAGVARISTTLRCQRWQLFESPQPWNFGNRPQVMGKIELSNFTNCWYIELPHLTSVNHFYGKYKPSNCGWCFYCFNNINIPLIALVNYMKWKIAKHHEHPSHIPLKSMKSFLYQITHYGDESRQYPDGTPKQLVNGCLFPQSLMSYESYGNFMGNLTYPQTTLPPQKYPDWRLVGELRLELMLAN